MHRAAYGFLVAAAALALAVLGLAAGLRLAGPAPKQTRLGTVSLRVAPSAHGNVDVFIPIANWGIRAPAFSAPVQLHVEPRNVNRQAVIAAAGGDRGVLLQAREDGRAAGRSALGRGLVWAIAGAAAVAALAAIATAAWRPQRRRRAAAFGLAVFATGTLLAVAVLLRAQATFDPSAFERPRFYARGAELAQLLKVAEKAQAGERAYSNSVERTLSGYASLLQAGTIKRVPTELPGVLISDLHANVLVLDSLKRLAAGRPVFFAGDVGQAGTDAEAKLLVKRVVAIGRPMIAVSGNHDSALLMRRLAAAGVRVLTETGRLRSNGSTDGEPVQRVGDLLVAGYADPLEAHGDPNDPERVFSFSERPDGDAEFERAAEAVRAWFDGLVPRPNVVMIHQNGLAQSLARAVAAEPDATPLLILTGHDHKQHVDVYGGVTVLDAGTVGAGGIFGAGRASIGIAQIHLAESPSEVRAIDLIRFEPISGIASADRVVVGSEEACDVDRVTCHGPPVPTG